MNSMEEIKAIRDQRAAEAQAMREAQERQAQGEAMRSMGDGMQSVQQGAAALPPEAIRALQGSIPPRDMR